MSSHVGPIPATNVFTCWSVPAANIYTTVSGPVPTINVYIQYIVIVPAVNVLKFYFKVNFNKILLNTVIQLPLAHDAQLAIYKIS